MYPNARDFLKVLAAFSIQNWAGEPKGDGRPVYPYPLATTKAERMAHVKRRQSNKRRGGTSAYLNHKDRADKGRGVSRKMFVPIEYAEKHGLGTRS